MTIEEFKKQKIESMKMRDTNAVNAYNSIISKLMLLKIEKQAVGEELSDSDVLACLKKVKKEITEEKENFEKAGREEEVKNLNEQLKVVDKYIPDSLGEDKIKEEIEKLSDKSVPSVMKHFKTNFAGRVDMKLVSLVLKQMQ